MSEEIRTRRDDLRVIDHVAARSVGRVSVESVELTRCSATEWALVIETRNERAVFSIAAAHQSDDVAVALTGRVSINRRSDAQRRRWAALTVEQRKRKRLR